MAFRRSGVRIPLAPPTLLRNADQQTPRREPAGGSFIQGQGSVTTTGDSATGTPGVREGRGRIERYDPTTIEPRWQARWDELGLHRTDLSDDSKPRFYLLTMYDYPSGDLHIGHWYVKTPTDAIGRYQRMHGDNVFLPIGLRRASGCPPRTRRSRTGRPPARVDDGATSTRCAASCGRWAPRGTGTPRSSPATPTTTAGTSGCSCSSWRRGWPIATMSAVDWCPNDGTLAREQVEGADRHCWRCGAKVEKRDLEQWFLRITNYADELLDFGGIDWPDPIRIMQTNWIGRSEGAEIVFETAPSAASRRRRGAARLHDAARHAVRGHVHGAGAGASAGRATLTAPERQAEVEAYVARGAGARPRSTGCRPTARRPASPSAPTRSTRSTASGSRSSIADYVLGGYGTGAIMAVPAHDERDFEFAKRFGLPIVSVVMPKGADPDDATLESALRRAHRRRGPGQLRPVHRPAGGRGWHDDRRLAGGARARARRPSPTACATGWSAASATGARRSRSSTASACGIVPGARGPAAGAAARHRRLPRQRREPADPGRGVPERRLPVVRRPGQARDGHAWTRSSTRPGTGSATCRRTRTTARRPRPGRVAGRPSTSTRAAPSTPSCTCCTAASSPRRCATSAWSRSASRSGGCSTRARSWAPTASG